MATSFISYKNKGIWIEDSILELAIIFILKHLDDDSDWLMPFKERLRNNKKGYFVGFMNLGLDKHLSDIDKINYFSKVLDNAISELLSRKNLSLTELNSFENKKDYELRRLWKSELNTKDIVDALVNLKKIVSN